MIKYAEDNQLLTSLIPPLEMIKKQRNYLAHNIHALLLGLIEETILESSNLLDSDVTTYTERAFVLNENLVALSEIVEKEE